MEEDDKDVPKVTIVHCWSAPRSRSTALLYSFEARGDDTVVLDEALYREWLLARKETVVRPYLDAIFTGKSPDGTNQEKWEREQPPFTKRVEQAVQKLIQKNKNGGVVYCKNMAKYIVDMNWVKDIPVRVQGCTIVQRHMLLIRDPFYVVSSWEKDGPNTGNNCSPDEVGILALLNVYSSLTSTNPPRRVVVVDSDDLADDPRKTLVHLCEDLDIPFCDNMMSWKSGEHECDGPWAKWWYGNVHKTEGFLQRPRMAPLTRYRCLDPELMNSFRIGLAAYQFLKTLVTTTTTTQNNVLVWVGTPGRGQVLPHMPSTTTTTTIIGEETFCVRHGKIVSLQEHLNRLVESACDNPHPTEEIKEAIFRTLVANRMWDNTLVKVTLSRHDGNETTLVVLPEWTSPLDETKSVALVSVKNGQQDSALLVDSENNNILLDDVFLVVEGGNVVVNSLTSGSLPSVARQNLIGLLGDHNDQRRLSLADLCDANEAFVVSSIHGVTPITMVDGKRIGVRGGDTTTRLQKAYRLLPGTPVPGAQTSNNKS